MRLVQIPNIKLGELYYRSNNSIIYKGLYGEAEKRVFIKMPVQLSKSETAQLEIKREFDLLQEAQGPHVIRAYDLCDTSKGYALILEDCGGTDLLSHIKAGPLNIKKFCFLAREMASALSEIHQKNIIHKDISPANFVYNSETQQVKVIDFGISTKVDQESQNAAHQDGLEGNLDYISPEQTGRTARDLDYRTDFYSLGASLFKLLLGEPPFKAKDELSLIHCHLARTPKRADALNPDVPKVIADIIEKLMQKNMEDRYQSSSSLIADLTKCIEYLSNDNAIPDFIIAMNDISEKFMLPQRLIGRDRETKQLLEVFERVCHGSRELILLGGTSGMGKTRLISEAKIPMALNHAVFLKGKFDQFNRDIPYSAIIQALGKDYVDYLLKQDDSVFSHWQSILKNRLSTSAKLITKLIPRMEKVLDTPLILPEMDPQQLQSQFYHAMSTLFQVISSAHHPLVLFLDDLQWADGASLALVEALLTNDSQKNCLVICSFRDDEVSQGHPFMDLIENLRDRAKITELELGPLLAKDITQMVAESLHQETNETQKLGKVIHARTGGNPFFASSYLMALFYDQIIYFDHKKGSWSFIFDKVKSYAAPSTMVHFMMNRLEDLSAETRSVLQIAACLGNTFSFQKIFMLTKKSYTTLSNSLIEAVEKNILYPLDGGYRLLAYLGDSDRHLERNIEFKFQHDKIQQACYQSIPEDSLQKTHLDIARILNKQGCMSNEQKIALAYHYSQAQPLITDPDEKYHLCKLNIDVSEIALEAGANDIAYKHARNAKSLLNKNLSLDEYELGKKMNFLLTMSAFYSGNEEEGENYCLNFLNFCKTNVEKAKVMLLVGEAFATYTSWEKSLFYLQRAYAYLGKKIPRFYNPLKILYKYLKVKSISVNAEYIQALPYANEKDELEITILERMNQSLHQLSRPIDFLYVLMETVIRVNANGKSRYTHPALIPISQYCVLMSFDGPSKRTQSILELVPVMIFSSEDSVEKSRALFLLSVLSYQLLPDSMIDRIKESISLSRSTRDYMSLVVSLGVYGTCSLHSLLNQQLESLHKYDVELDQLNSKSLQNDCRFQIEALARMNQKDPVYEISNEAQSYYGQVETVSSLCSCEIQEAKVLFIEGQFEKSYEWIRKAESRMIAVKYLIWEVYVVVMGFLIRAALYPSASGLKKIQMLLVMKLEYKFIMNRWALNPQNFRLFKILMDAEWSRIRRNDISETLSLYDKVLNDEESNSAEWKAITQLTAFRCSQKQSSDYIKYGYLEQAILALDAWGAKGLVERLEKQYQPLLNSYRKDLGSLTESKEKFTRGQSTHLHTMMSQLDTNLILDISRSLSTEIYLKDLLTKLLDSVIENAGATKAALLIYDDESGSLSVEASKLGVDKKTVVEKVVVDRCDYLPSKILNHALRLKELLIIDDAKKHTVTKDDPWIIENPIKSLIIMPLENRGKFVGFIYLENEELASSFTPDKVELIGVLASQAAISIENSQLYETLEERIREKTKDIRSILDNITQGIFLLQDDYTIHSDYSSYLKDIFEVERISGLTFQDLLFIESNLTADVKSQIQSALLGSFGEPMFCYEINSHFLINEVIISRNGVEKVLSIDWNPILGESDLIERFLICVKDVTELKRLEIEARQGREELNMVGQILSIDPDDFARLVKSCNEWLYQMRQVSYSTEYNELDKASKIFIHMHTMKGLTQTLGLSYLSTVVHECEQVIQDVRDRKDIWDHQSIEQKIKLIENSFGRYVNLASEKLKRINHPSQKERFNTDCLEGWLCLLQNVATEHKDSKIDQVIREMEMQYYIPASDLFEEVFASVGRLAKEVNKPVPTLSLSLDDLSFSPSQSELLRNVFLHLIKNSLDHGIEPTEMRKKKGKLEQGEISLSVLKVGDLIRLEFLDDGAGLNLPRIRDLAVQKGLITPELELSPQQVSELICMPGFSTKEKVTSISGRGVGMDAVKSYLENQGASLSIILNGHKDDEIRPFKVSIEIPFHPNIILNDAS